MSRMRRGMATNTTEILETLNESDAPMCAAWIAIPVLRGEDQGAVLLIMAEQEGDPVAFMPLECSHAVEAVIDKIRKSAEKAFGDKPPCTVCEVVP